MLPDPIPITTAIFYMYIPEKPASCIPYIVVSLVLEVKKRSHLTQGAFLWPG